MNSHERWHLAEDTARLYELHVASWFAPWALDLVDRAELRSGGRVLDVACGTGVVTRAAASALGSSGEVVATDLNPGMVAEAQNHAVDGASVQWQTADATDLPFESDSFDAVLCQQGLQFVPDKAAAVREMKRVVRSGGTAAVSVWRSLEQNPWSAALANGLTRSLSPEAGQMMAAPSAFDDREALGALFADAGFASVDVEAVELTRSADDARAAIEGNLSALPVAGEIVAMAGEDYTGMIDRIVASLGGFVIDNVLTVPTRSLVLTALS